MRIPFDDNNSPKGIEGKECIENSVLYIYIEATNCFIDWFISLLFIPVPLDWLDWSKGIVHLGYKSYSKWLTGYIQGKLSEHPEITEVHIDGWSMGGGIAQPTGKQLKTNVPDLIVIVKNIDGACTVRSCPEFVTTYYKKGSFVHLLLMGLFQHSKSVCVKEEFEPIWKSHAWSWTEIEEVINGIS